MNKEYLFDLPDEKILLISSFFVTNKKALDKLRSQWASRDTAHSRVVGRTKQQTSSLSSSEYGGSIALIDPNNLESGFITELDVHMAFGLCFNTSDFSLYVASGAVVRQIKHGVCVKELSHPLFNDLHSITISNSGNLLVTSTGTDAILEIAFEDASTVYWDWLATENRFNKNPSGEPCYVDRSTDYRKVLTSTPEHTTHINTALNDTPNRVLATLFHQGALVEIDIASKEHRVLLDGLKSPHNIRLRSGGYLLSDSRANKVLLLDGQFKVESRLTGDFHWVQDALELGNRSYLVGDSNNDQIVKIDDKSKVVEKMSWEKSSRKFASFELITAKQARKIFLPKRNT
ncbi:MAG: hypothetical protein ABH951_02770 [Patescibacteria group bacterium]